VVVFAVVAWADAWLWLWRCALPYMCY